MHRTTLLGTISMLIACRVRTPATDVDDFSTARTRVFEQASRDFGCPLDEITQGPCACVGAVVVEACGVTATYGISRQPDGDYVAVLSIAALPPPTAKGRR
jgi:hypothetical protein